MQDSAQVEGTSLVNLFIAQEPGSCLHDREEAQHPAQNLHAPIATWELP